MMDSLFPADRNSVVSLEDILKFEAEASGKGLASRRSTLCGCVRHQWAPMSACVLSGSWSFRGYARKRSLKARETSYSIKN